MYFSCAPYCFQKLCGESGRVFAVSIIQLRAASLATVPAQHSGWRVFEGVQEAVTCDASGLLKILGACWMPLGGLLRPLGSWQRLGGASGALGCSLGHPRALFCRLALSESVLGGSLIRLESLWVTLRTV